MLQRSFLLSLTVLALLFAAGPRVTTSPAFAQDADADADAALSWNQRGLELSSKGQFEAALKAFHKADGLAPGDAIVKKNVALTHANWGVALLKAGKLEDAEAQTRLALKVLPDDPIVRLNLAECLDRRGYPARAAKQVLLAAKNGPEVAAVQRKLGAVHYREGRLAEAVAVWEKAVSLDPKHASTKTRLGRAKASLALEKRLSYDVSANFTIYFEMEKHAVLASLVLRELEDAHQIVQTELQSTSRERLKVVLLSAEEFSAVTGAHTWVAGLFDGQIRLPVKDAGDKHEILLRTARHEYVHAVLAKLGRRAPSWLHEGLAQVHEGRPAKSARARLKATKVRLAYADLTRTFAATAKRDRARQQYDTALAFTAWLREGERTSAYSSALQALFAGASLEKAFQDAYDKTLPKLYEQFDASLTQ